VSRPLGPFPFRKSSKLVGCLELTFIYLK